MSAQAPIPLDQVQTEAEARAGLARAEAKAKTALQTFRSAQIPLSDVKLASGRQKGIPLREVKLVGKPKIQKKLTTEQEMAQTLALAQEGMKPLLTFRSAVGPAMEAIARRPERKPHLRSEEQYGADITPGGEFVAGALDLAGRPIQAFDTAVWGILRYESGATENTNTTKAMYEALTTGNIPEDFRNPIAKATRKAMIDYGWPDEITDKAVSLVETGTSPSNALMMAQEAVSVARAGKLAKVPDVLKRSKAPKPKLTAAEFKARFPQETPKPKLTAVEFKERFPQPEPKPPEPAKPPLTPKTPVPPEGGPTGITHAATDADRAARNLPAIERAAAEEAGQWLEDGKKLVASTPNWRETVKQWGKANTPLTERQEGAILHDRTVLYEQQRTLIAEHDAALEAGDEAKAVEARTKLAGVEEAIDDNHLASKNSHSAWGRTGRAAQMMEAEDYSLVHLEARARAASGSRTIAPDVAAKLKDLSERIAAAESQLSKLTAEREAGQVIERLKPVGRRVAKARDLDAQLADLVRRYKERTKGTPTVKYFGSGPDTEAIKLIGQIAKIYVEKGVNELGKLVDAVRESLGVTAEEMSDRELRDAITRYGMTAHPSTKPVDVALRELKAEGRLVSALEDAEAGESPLRSGFQRGPMSEKVKALRKQVDDAMRKHGLKAEKSARTPEEVWQSKLKAYKKRLETEKTRLEGQLASGKFEKKAKPALLKLDEPALKLKAEIQDLKAQANREVRKQQLANRSLPRKAGDFFLKWRREWLLTGLTTIGKITTAAGERIGISPFEELTGSVWEATAKGGAAIESKIGVKGPLTKIRDIAAKAPREGGLSIKAEAEALTHLFDKATLRDAWETFRGRPTELDALVGHGAKDLPVEARGFFGRIHGALKTPAKRAEFFKSFQKRTEDVLRHGGDITDPRVQSEIAAGAYDDSMRAIFMQDNMVVDAFRVATRFLRQEKYGAAGQALAGTADFLLPIVKVPTNFVAEGLNYLPPVAATKIFVKLAFGKAASEMTPAMADVFMRTLKKGSLGSAAMLIGYYFKDSIGGYYEPGQKDDGTGKVKPGGLRILGWDVPKAALHHPVIMAIQLGATYGHVKERYSAKGKGTGEALKETGYAAARTIGEDVPFVRTGLDLAKFFQNEPTAEKGLGKMVADTAVPQVVREIAAKLDPDGKRFPQGFWDEILVDIPGARASVSNEPKRKPSLHPRRPSFKQALQRSQ